MSTAGASAVVEPLVAVRSPSALIGLVTIVMTLVGWSSVPLFITHFSKAIDFWTQNGWRYGFSALLWAPVLIVGALGWSGRGLPQGLWRAALVPALFNTLGQIAFTWSFYNIDAATATFGLRMQIVFVVVGAYLLFPTERAVLRRPAAWIGVAMVLGGTFAMMLLGRGVNGPREVVGMEARYGLGVVLALLSGLFFAAYGLSVRRFMHGFHPVTAFAAISQYTALAMVVLMLLMARDQGGRHDLGGAAWAMAWGPFGLLLLSGVIGIALGHVFYYISIARLGVAVSSGVVQLQPFCVTLAKYWLFGEILTLGQLASGTVAVGGAVMLLVVQWMTMRQRHQRQELEVEEPGS